MPATKKFIRIYVPSKTGVSREENGKIVRVVGNSMAYVNLPSGRSFAFSSDDIEEYSGQTLSSLGVREGAPVHVTPDAHSDSHISVLVSR